MRILQVSSATTFGGGEKHLVDLSCGLIGRGHEVHLTIRPSCGFKDRLADVGFSSITELPLRGSVDIVSAFRLSRLIRQVNAEVVHAHLARDYTVASFACRLARDARLVLTRHVLFPVSVVTAFLTGNVHKIIAVSPGVEESLAKSFPRRKIVQIPNGIDLGTPEDPERLKSGEAFREEHGIPEEARLIVTVGELRPLKGQEEFLIAASEVLKTQPGTRFLIVGNDHSPGGSYRRKLRRLAASLGMGEDVIFLNWVDDTVPMLAAADCFVSSSRSESFGLAILEAMAAGTPVVATKTAGAESLLAGNCGIFAEIGDALSIADGIRTVLSDATSAAEMAQSARSRAEGEFSLEKMVGLTEDLYSELAVPPRS